MHEDRPPPMTTTNRAEAGASRADDGQLDGDTLATVATVLGLSRERVRQIEREALVKCARWCEARGYQLADLLPDNERSTDYE
jgi:hypothetical protein